MRLKSFSRKFNAMETLNQQNASEIIDISQRENHKTGQSKTLFLL